MNPLKKTVPRRNPICKNKIGEWIVSDVFPRIRVLFPRFNKPSQLFGVLGGSGHSMFFRRFYLKIKHARTAPHTRRPRKPSLGRLERELPRFHGNGSGVGEGSRRPRPSRLHRHWRPRDKGVRKFGFALRQRIVKASLPLGS